MSDKSNSDHPTGETPAVSKAPEVNRSRRRFTGAGLSASAILTLASRPTFGTTCSLSGSLSGNTSTPGAVTCAGKDPTFYKEKVNWPAGFEAGLKHPLEVSTPTYRYATFDEVNTVAEGTNPDGTPVAVAYSAEMQSECMVYRDWAWPEWRVGVHSYPTPISPEPNNFNTEFAEAGLYASDPYLTLMQALEDYSDDIQGHAVAALFNCYTFGVDKFGYTPASLMQYIRECDPTQLLTNLRLINGRS